MSIIIEKILTQYMSTIPHIHALLIKVKKNACFMLILKLLFLSASAHCSLDNIIILTTRDLQIKSIRFKAQDNVSICR